MFTNCNEQLMALFKLDGMRWSDVNIRTAESFPNGVQKGDLQVYAWSNPNDPHHSLAAWVTARPGTPENALYDDLRIVLLERIGQPTNQGIENDRGDCIFIGGER